MGLLLGSAVKFSFTTFLAIQPMAATKPVRTAASVTVLTSLLSDDIVEYVRREKVFNMKLITLFPHFVNDLHRWRFEILALGAHSRHELSFFFFVFFAP